MRALFNGVVVVLVLTALAGCNDKAVKTPPPQELTREGIGYYCNMIVYDHKGPKGQIFVRDVAEPIWFSSVRDGVAFTMLPGEPRNILAFYVNDMAKVTNWDQPEPGTWMHAVEAYFVIGSTKRGGMGALEAVPFSIKEKAKEFVARYGGRIVKFTDLPQDYIFAEAQPEQQDMRDKNGN